MDQAVLTSYSGEEIAVHKPKLLPPSHLVKTGKVDHADWNYAPLLGSIQRHRFQLVCKLLSDRHFSRMLEIGYGSGVFLPELASSCDELHGIDIHDKDQLVRDRLAAVKVAAWLARGTAEAMPYDNGYFDCVVAVSVLEFLDDLHAACREIERILQEDGILIVVTPGYSPLVDLGLRILTGARAREDYGNRRTYVIPILSATFRLHKMIVFPRIIGSLVCLYRAMEFRKQEKHARD